MRVRSRPLLIITHDTGPRAAMRSEALVTRMAFTPHTEARKIVNCEGEEGYILRIVLNAQVSPSRRKILKTRIDYNRITRGRNMALHNERMVAGCYGI